MKTDDFYLNLIRNVPDFPKKGIQFKDITTLIKDPAGLKNAVDDLVATYKKKGITKIVGIESRGFIFGAAMAYVMGVGFIPIRKPGKLPAAVKSMEYSLEYGTDKIEIHVDAVAKGDKVLLVDDLLATGGTAAAAAKLIESLGGKVEGIAFVIELTGSLHGRDLLKGHDVTSLVKIPVHE